MAQNEKLPQNENNTTNSKVAMGDDSGNPLQWLEDLKNIGVAIKSVPAVIQESSIAMQALYRNAAIQIAKVSPALQKLALQFNGKASTIFEKLGEKFSKEAAENVAKNLNISVKEVWQGIAKSNPKIAVPFQEALQKMHIEFANAINKIPNANIGINKIFNKSVQDKALNGSSKYINNEIGTPQKGTHLKEQLDGIMKSAPPAQAPANSSNLLDKLLKIINSSPVPSQKTPGIKDPPAGAFKPKPQPRR